MKGLPLIVASFCFAAPGSKERQFTAAGGGMCWMTVN